MSDTQNQAEDTSETQENQENTQGNWSSVAGDFQTLGQSIADAIKGVVQDEKYKEQLTELRVGLQNMTEQVAGAIEEAISSSTAEGVKAEVKKAASEVKETGGKVYGDAKPFLAHTLKTINEGIQGIIDRIETSPTDAPEAETATEPEDESACD